MLSPSLQVRRNLDFATELKFLVPAARAAEIRQWARKTMAADPHGSGEAGDTYRVTSIYLDTENLDVYHKRRSFGRAKYRVRKYGSNELAFLERKMKVKGRVGKMRKTAGFPELPKLADTTPEKGWDGYWFHRRLLARGLRPTCQISYHRTARVAMSPTGPIRLTIDEDLSVIAPKGFRFQSRETATPIFEGYCVVELKFRQQVPLLFKELMETFLLTPQKASKYRTAIRTLGLVPSREKERHGAPAPDLLACPTF
jgi:hypothetical protein